LQRRSKWRSQVSPPFCIHNKSRAPRGIARHRLTIDNAVFYHEMTPGMARRESNVENLHTFFIHANQKNMPYLKNGVDSLQNSMHSQ
jgi:hypothetical protein